LARARADGVDAVGLLHEQALHLDHEFLGVLGRRRRLDHELARSSLTSAEQDTWYARPRRLADLVEQRRAHAFAEERGRHGVGVLRLVGERGNRQAEHDVASGRARRSPRAGAAAYARRRHAPGVPRGSPPKLCSTSARCVGIDATGGADDEVGADVRL
jgi:hypothetical protein